MQRKERIQKFVKTIWQWYATHKRTLPWRDLPDTDPAARAYKILVSEIMLQQTQVPRVIIKFKEFLERFPTIDDLARASNKDVIIAWRGMGYNSRALRLRDVAREIVKSDPSSGSGLKVKNDHRFPTSMEDLTALPGIGHYTAAAIRNFAFNIPTPCIDTNIRRILHRTFVGPEHPDGSWENDDKFLLKIADEVLQIAGRPADWHAALMDYGSLVQTKKNPKWDVCVLTRSKIMKTTPRNFPTIKPSSHPTISGKQEPGRHVGSTFIPNRIFRGRVIEALRDAPRGLTLHDIGVQVALDWDPQEHQEWLKKILTRLVQETMIGVRRGKYVLG